MTVCKRIDTILKERGMSRRKLALMAGIAPSSFQSAMARNRSLSLDMLIPISDVLGVSVEYLNTGATTSPQYTDDELLVMYNSNFATPQKEDIYTKLLSMIPKLNELGLQKVVERVEELLELPKYRNEWRDENDGIL